MPFYVYILRCSDGSYYTGHTDGIDRRMAQHGDGTASAYTSKRRPLELLWATDCQTREQAFDLEKQIQGAQRSPFDRLRVSAGGAATRESMDSVELLKRSP